VHEADINFPRRVNDGYDAGGDEKGSSAQTPEIDSV
jgi:hypothetical protein